MRTVHYTAAGGVVLDGAGRVLLIERDVERGGRLVHEIRLPKGHVEPGENHADAAVREVCEESGYCELAILADLGIVENRFDREGYRVERREHFFLMRALAGSRHPPRPGSEEEARFHPLWVATLEDASRLLTFESEREFVRRARDVLDERR